MWEELLWHLSYMRRGRGEVGCGAGYAVLECSPMPVAWAELVEAACGVSYSVLLDLFGKFILVFWLFCIRRPQCLYWSLFLTRVCARGSLP